MHDGRATKRRRIANDEPGDSHVAYERPPTDDSRTIQRSTSVQRPLEDHDTVNVPSDQPNRSNRTLPRGFTSKTKPSTNLARDSDSARRHGRVGTHVRDIFDDIEGAHQPSGFRTNVATTRTARVVSEGNGKSGRAKGSSDGMQDRNGIYGKNVQADASNTNSNAKMDKTLSAKKTRSLDPLRNQRENALSPAKTPSRVAASMGFFKQFASPKKNAEPSPFMARMREVMGEANGSGAKKQFTGVGNEPEEKTRKENSEDEVENSGGELGQTSPTRSISRTNGRQLGGIGNRGAVIDKGDSTRQNVPRRHDLTIARSIHQAEASSIPQSETESRDHKGRDAESNGADSEVSEDEPERIVRKTFEDEIRDLEEAAKRNAEAEDEDDWNVLHRPKRQNAGVHRRHQPEVTLESIRLSAKKSRTPRSASSNKVRVSKRDHHGAEAMIAGRAENHAEEVTSPGSQQSEISIVVASHLPAQAESIQKPKMVKEVSSSFGPIQAQTPTKIKPRTTKITPKKHILPGFNTVTGEGPVADKDQGAEATARQPLQTTTFAASHLAVIQKILFAKLAGKRPIPLTGLAEEYSKVSTLIEHTINAGESNSMLIIGSRGTGKSAMVEQIIREQSVQHADDFLVVRLNGFIHTDDKIALRHIWQQLGREMEIEETEHAIKNHADTLTTLLALLSHAGESVEDGSARVTKSVIFIMDEFDLFTHHPRQTLLYNLFDIAQSRKAPIAVLGLTTRVDVVESLEKRVKSRFSHRYAHLSLPKTFAAFRAICTAAMSVDAAELSESERQVLDTVEAASPVAMDVDGQHNTIISQWNSLIEHVMTGPRMTAHLQKIYHRSKSVAEFCTSQLLAIGTPHLERSITSDELCEYLEDLSSRPTLQQPDSSLMTLSALSLLQLALLICAARLDAIFDADVVTFALAYNEYKTLASKAKIQASAAGALTQGANGRVSSKNVARDAWEGLVEYGLIFDDGRGNGRVDVGLEEIGMSGVDLGPWARWCKEI